MGDLEAQPIKEDAVTPDEFLASTKAEQIAALKEKFAEYPEFVKLSEAEKIDILVVAHAEELEQKALAAKQAAFQEARMLALGAQVKAGLEEVELARVKVYKEKLALEQKWNDAAATGEWDIPK